MQIKEYPAAIAKAANECRRLESDVWAANNYLAELNQTIETTIALDPDMKNDQQRKAGKLELQQAQEYKDARSTLRKAEGKLESSQIQLTLLRDLFRVEILEYRERIARLESDRMIA